MSITVRFLGPAAQDFSEALTLEAATLEQVAQAFAADARAQKWLKISAVAINGKIATSANAALADGDVVEILPPVCGG